jgi:hypothetical protein
MYSDNLQFAPSVTNVDGLIAVPIDILQLDAKVTFDINSRNAKSEGTMKFQMQ